MPSVEAPELSPFRDSGCRNLALPGVYEQALHFPRLLRDLLFAELDAHIFFLPPRRATQRSGRTPSVTSRRPRDPVAPYFRMNPR